MSAPLFKVSRLRAYVPKTGRECAALLQDKAQENLHALCSEVLPRIRVEKQLDTLKLTDDSRNVFRGLPQTCASYADELKRVHVKYAVAGEDGLSPLRVVAKCLDSGPTTTADLDGQADAHVSCAEALGFLLKAYLLEEYKRLGEAAFKAKYNEHRKQSDGLFPINKVESFLQNLAVPGRQVALERKLLAVVGGLVGADFLLVRISKDRSQMNNAANTTITRLYVPADPQALELAAQYRPVPTASASQAGPDTGSGPSTPTGGRPVIPLLETVEAHCCIYRALEPLPGAFDVPVSQVTNWEATEELRIWLPEPAECWVPLSRLRDLDYPEPPEGGVYWTVVRSGRSQLVLQMKRRHRSGVLIMDNYFGDRPVAEVVPGTDGRVVRLLAPGPAGSGEDRSDGPTAPLPQGGAASVLLKQEQQQQQEEQLKQTGTSPAREQQLPVQQQPHAAMVDAEGQSEPAPQASADMAAKLTRVARKAAKAILKCSDIGFLAQEQPGRAASHLSARETAVEVAQRAAVVRSFQPSRLAMHLVMASNAGAGKTTVINKAIAELVASPGQLRAVLQAELHGDLGPDEVPGTDTTTADFFRIFGVQPGAARHGGGASLSRFSYTCTPLTVAQDVGSQADPRFMQGGEFDYFDLVRHGVSEEVQEHLGRSWDEQPHLQELGDRYNLCRPRVRGREYGCFMPNGMDTHCTHRVQHVHMFPAGSPDEAAFRFRLQLPSREAVNRQIHQYRQYVRGELPFSQLDPEAYINVPYMCGLMGDNNEEDENEDEEDERFERLLAVATTPDDELLDSDDEEGGEGGRGRPGSGSDRDAARGAARETLLARLYPLQRYTQWLGQAVEFRLLTDDVVAASKWAEFFSTRFILQQENAAFTLRDGAAMHVPSGSLPVHIMDLPGMAMDKHLSNAMAAAEVEAGLRSVLGNVGQGHTLIIMPSTGRESSSRDVIRRLQEAQLLQEAVRQPEEITLVSLINLKPKSNVVRGLMESARSGSVFAQSCRKLKYPRQRLAEFEEALSQAATDLEPTVPGAKRMVESALKAKQLLRSFCLDVGAGMVEDKDFHDDPQVKPYLFSSFVAYLAETQQRYVEATRHRVHGAMWEALGGMALEGVGLAKRLQGPVEGGPARQPGNDGEGDAASDNEDEVTSLSEGAAQQRRVARALREVLGLQASFDAGAPAWAAEVQRVIGGSVDTPVPLTLGQLPAWVEGAGSQLRRLVEECTSELAAAQLQSRWWREDYEKKNSRKLGNDLTSSDLWSTHLPEYLISRLQEGGEAVLAGLLERFVSRVVELDVELVRTHIRRTREHMEAGNAALKSNTEVQLLLDVFEESIAEVLGRKRRTVAKLLQCVRRGSGMDSVWQGRSLTSRWREAIDNPDARQAALHVYQKTRGRTRTQRLLKVRTEFLEEWKKSLVPTLSAADGGGGRPGRLADVVEELAQQLLQYYRRKRARVIREAMAAARSSTVSTLGPMALRVVRAGLAAVRTVAAAASTPSEALLRELQAAMQAAKQAKAARMQVLHATYAPTDPLELLQAAADDGNLWLWAEEMSGEPQRRPLQAPRRQQPQPVPQPVGRPEARKRRRSGVSE